jgi:hypothetical protein
VSDEDAGRASGPADLGQYAIVANRRQQWDTLLWQMPTMSLTGVAFLFTIALGPSTSVVGRVISSLLALVIALVCLHSLSGHRISEITDATWLHEHEHERGGAHLHGLSWRERRQRVVEEQRRSASLTDRLVARSWRFRSIEIWFWTMAFIAGTALVVLVISVVDAHLLVG